MNPTSFRTLLAVAAIVLPCSILTRAHDTWVQTNTNVVRTGDKVWAFGKK